MSFQNRLSYYQDKRNAKLTRNNIKRSGVYLDTIHVTTYRDAQYDTRRMTIEGFQFVPVIMPFETIEGMETRLGKTKDGTLIPHLMIDKEELQLYIESTAYVIDKDDLIFWVVENYSDPKKRIDPAILVLKVKNVQSHFGSYGIIFQGYTCTTENPDRLPDELINELKKAHSLRQAEILARHKRTQLEP